MAERKALRAWTLQWSRPGAVHASAEDTVIIEVWREAPVSENDSPRVMFKATRENRHEDGQQMLLLDADWTMQVSPDRRDKSFSAVHIKGLVGENITALGTMARYADWITLEVMLTRLLSEPDEITSSDRR